MKKSLLFLVAMAFATLGWAEGPTKFVAKIVINNASSVPLYLSGAPITQWGRWTDDRGHEISSPPQWVEMQDLANLGMGVNPPYASQATGTMNYYVYPTNSNQVFYGCVLTVNCTGDGCTNVTASAQQIAFQWAKDANCSANVQAPSDDSGVSTVTFKIW